MYHTQAMPVVTQHLYSIPPYILKEKEVQIIFCPSRYQFLYQFYF